MPGHILILSGWRGVGKTSVCEHIIFAARRASWDVAGLISPPDLSSGEKRSILVQDLRTGERRKLARSSGSDDNTLDSLTPAWVFDPGQLAWGDAVLRDAVPCDLLVIDELGPLELLSDEGWQAGIEAIDSGNYRLALVVIRPELLEVACWRWPMAETMILDSYADIPSVATTITRRYFRLSQAEDNQTEG